MKNWSIEKFNVEKPEIWNVLAPRGTLTQRITLTQRNTLTTRSTLTIRRPRFSYRAPRGINIEASEYPLFADAFRRLDEKKLFQNTKQIHMETHRMGMHTNGINFNSLVFLELLFATFYSAGYSNRI